MDLVRGTAARQEELDRVIAEALTPDWPLERLERVLRAILRAGAYELLARPDVPAAVVISEYLDIGHAFFAGKEPGLINGVLDRLAVSCGRMRSQAESMAADPRLDEFERIARFFAPLAAPEALGLLDDVALIPGPAGEQYVLKTVAIVEGVHFLADDPPEQVAQKLLRVNLSDLAAKGAAPFGYLLTIACRRRPTRPGSSALPPGSRPIRRLTASACSAAISVATPGPATLSVTAIGRIAAGRAVLRRGARTGDRIYVSGTVGDAALGVLAAKGRDLGLAPADRDFLVGRFRLPQPRLNLGARLVGLASSTTDISDGLAADLGHLSKVGRRRHNRGEAAARSRPRRKRRSRAIPRGCRSCWAAATITSCCFTAAAGAEAHLGALSRELESAITAIGRVEAGQGVRALDAAGSEIACRGRRL